MGKKSKKIQKKKKVEAINKKQASFFSRHKKAEIVISIIIALIAPPIGESFYESHQENLSKFGVLEASVRTLFSANRAVYDSCANNEGKARIIQNMQYLADSHIHAINAHAALGHLVSLNTYCELHRFTHYNDQLRSFGDQKVCKALKRNRHQLSSWQNTILSSIDKDKERQEQILSATNEYFKRSIEIHYHPEDCQSKI